MSNCLPSSQMPKTVHTQTTISESSHPVSATKEVIMHCDIMFWGQETEVMSQERRVGWCVISRRKKRVVYNLEKILTHS